VNYTNISNAIKAIDGIKNKPDYANLRIAHGKDRCANPPRSGPQGASGVKRTASGQTAVTSGDPDGEREFSEAIVLGDDTHDEPTDFPDGIPEANGS
jgi:hypothetical protein